MGSQPPPIIERRRLRPRERRISCISVELECRTLSWAETEALRSLRRRLGGESFYPSLCTGTPGVQPPPVAAPSLSLCRPLGPREAGALPVPSVQGQTQTGCPAESEFHTNSNCFRVRISYMLLVCDSNGTVCPARPPSECPLFPEPPPPQPESHSRGPLGKCFRTEQHHGLGKSPHGPHNARAGKAETQNNACERKIGEGGGS